MFLQALTRIQARSDGVGFPGEMRTKTMSVMNIRLSLEHVSNSGVVGDGNAAS
jgi:hypothetical protein